MKTKRPITKAVLAAAGYGTRFLPATKNQPKQMLPIIDKPIIHHVVEEMVASGIKDIILITQYGGGSMEDYFDNHVEIEHALEEAGKQEKLEMLRNIPKMANFIYTRQTKDLPYGNGTPLLVAKNLIDDDEAFVYVFADDLTLSDGKPVTKQLMDVYEKYEPKAVLGVQEVPDSEVHKYATVRYSPKNNYDYYAAEILEKMPLGKNPSNMAQFGRFILSHDVIEEATKLETGKDGELWLADILNKMALRGEDIIAQPIDGEWVTTGDPLTFIQTTLKFAMKREDLKKDLLNYMKDLVNAEA